MHRWSGWRGLIDEELMQLDDAPAQESDWAGDAATRSWQATTAGTYVHFDGNDRIEVAMEEIGIIEDAVTVEFWSAERRNSSRRTTRFARA